MMRSMFSGVSGLRIHQSKMDVIANNISNVNTVGYKSSRVTFNEVFNQTLSGASAASDTTGRGGINPMQIGLGANVASIDKIMTQGSAQRTDNPYDLMIEGDGFFVVSDANGQYFTRAGNFIIDESGNLSINGLRLNGWNIYPEYDINGVATGEFKVDKGMVEPLQIKGDNLYAPPKATTNIAFEGNLSASATEPVERMITFYDSLGNKYVADMIFERDLSSTEATGTVWNAYFKGTDDTNRTVKMYLNGDRKKDPIEIELDSSLEYPIELKFGANGQLTNDSITGLVWSLTDVEVQPVADFGTTITHDDEEYENAILIDFSGLHAFGSDAGSDGTTIRADTKDGNPPGDLRDISVGSDGVVTGRYSNGDTKPLFQIPLANFQNPAGLQKVGNNLFVPTANSGDFNGIGEEGSMLAGNLEMSNVDLAQEFTEMITTQRGFQANSRIITTSDEMLQELVNLKR